MTEERRREVHARRWLGPDGLVHETIPIVEFNEQVYMSDPAPRRFFRRETVCAFGVIRDEHGVAWWGASRGAVDIADDPAEVNCFGCMGGL